MKRNYVNIAFRMLLFLPVFSSSVFCAQEEAELPECLYAGVEQFCPEFWRNPLQNYFLSLLPATQESIKCFVADPKVIRALADKRFAIAFAALRVYKEARQRFQALPSTQQECIRSFVGDGNVVTDEELSLDPARDRLSFIEACDRFHAFFRYKPYMQRSDYFEKQLGIAVLAQVNGTILRSRPKTETLQESLLNMYMSEQRPILVHEELYDPIKDELNLDAYKNFMRNIKSFDGLVQKMKWELPPGYSFTPDFEEIDRWAAEQGRTNTLSMSEWHETHGEKVGLMPSALEKLNELITRGAMKQDPIEKALWFFMGLNQIRPFFDGNNRTARLVTELMLYCRGFRLNRPLDDETPEYARFLAALKRPELSDEELRVYIEEFGEFFKNHIERISHGRCWLYRADKPRSDFAVVGRDIDYVWSRKLEENPKVTEFPPFFLLHPTLNGSITFAEEAMPLEKGRARLNKETLIGVVTTKYDGFWVQTRHLEAYDWLSVVTGLSSALQDGTLPSINLMDDINAVLLRSTNPDAGRFRQSNKLWNWGIDGDIRFAKKPISFAELVVKMYLFTIKKQVLIDKGVYFDGLIYTEPLKKIIRELVVDKQMRQQFLGAAHVMIGNREVAPEFNDAEIDGWASEQERTGSFYLKPWLGARSFVFPDFDRIHDYLHELYEVVRAENSGFNKAITLLFGLIDLHPFIDGNKRTAVVMASMILIQHNLPPLIFDEAGEKLMNEYIVASRGSMKKRMMSDKLLQYIMRQMGQYEPAMKEYLQSITEQEEPVSQGSDRQQEKSVAQDTDKQQKKIRFAAAIKMASSKESTGVDARAAVRSVQTGQPLNAAMNQKVDPYKKKKTAGPRKKKKRRNRK